MEGVLDAILYDDVYYDLSVLRSLSQSLQANVKTLVSQYTCYSFHIDSARASDVQATSS